ncbi:MAG: bifunctional precorrin-2 dehydrogenase/sirohydrochlorin ferrochelatase [Dehalococcoidia bacterium]|nr:MAG: bifunctional precorrin-2 dehydrogenase/sirohydrochlorin ferrochelatase [bacterium]MCE7929239.1 bifunctional precorrin-2 dehydrogenase/sirohydrochlorin ferrochelatase [Chloroflexi bacterium CFX7]MCK6565052.1 bifunctional precorrin-2 dehydrogenase/sirohydrochlorin ferrochelatase [Dehalococcoidia bacterium]MCL4231581.1 bifunctional precorrin-2 dehydrogenase/sirohydrochlorin ferrochelatase [Dehalococcoidia bacterium]NUQ56266.1 bifunctional precorrin-2 dehydrogenase/sirohydrochlorin ferroche
MGLIIDFQPVAGHALVVGGGTVATRKVKSLAEAEFATTVIAPAVSSEIRLTPRTTVVEREFQPADLQQEPAWALVIACTGSREVNREVGRLARLARLPVLVADARNESTFFMPAVIRDGDLAVAVSTGGASPGTARWIREQIVGAIGPGWAKMVSLARAERETRRGRPHGRQSNDG